MGSEGARAGLGELTFALFRNERGGFWRVLGQSLVMALVTLVALAAVFGLAAVLFILGVIEPGDLEALDDPAVVDSPVVMAAVIGLYLALLIAMLFLQGVFRAAVLRQQIRDDYRSGLMGLRFGGEAWRLVLVTLIYALVVALTVLAVFLIGVAVFAGGFAIVDPMQPGPARLMTQTGFWIGGAALSVLALVWLIWVMARLSLASAITVQQQRLAFFASWTVSRGDGWLLAGAHALAWLVGVGVYFAATILLYLGLFAAAFALGGLSQDDVALGGMEIAALIGCAAGILVYLAACYVMDAVVIAVAGRYVATAPREA